MSSESPKWIALVLSVIAIAASTLSWFEAHRSRIINEEVNRPFLALSSTQAATATVAGKEDPATSAKSWLWLNIRNDGRTQALVSKNVANAKLSERTKSIVKGCEVHSDKAATTPEGLEILPGTEIALGLEITLTSPCRDKVVDVEVAIQVTYTNPASGIEYSQTFSTTVYDRFSKEGEHRPKGSR